AIGPLVPWRRGSWAVLGRLLRGPAATATVLAFLTWALGQSVSSLGHLSIGLVALGYVLPYLVIAVVLGEFWRATRGRARATGAGPAQAFAAVLRQNHRRYGGLIVHLGVVLVAIGVASSSVGKVEREATLKRGESLDLGRYHLAFTGLVATEKATHLLVGAAIDVTEAGRPAGRLEPGQRIYPGSPSPFASAALRHG